MEKQSGIFLIATGIIHNAIGIMIGWPILKVLFLEGLFNTVDTQFDRNFIFWFLFSGFMMMYLGALMHHVLRRLQQPLPPFVGWTLLILGCVGCFIMPKSGFWLVLPQSLLILMKQPKPQKVEM